MMITVLRYLFVVHSMKVKSLGMVRVVSSVIVISVLLPFLMTISVQYPVSDFIHGPLNLCIGRFEVYFNPYHPDTKTEGKKGFFSLWVHLLSFSGEHKLHFKENTFIYFRMQVIHPFCVGTKSKNALCA